MRWLGHAGFLFALKTGKKVVIDPYKMKEEDIEQVDIILITHPHFDHCSPDDIEKVYKEGTVIIAPKDCVDKIGRKVTVIRPNEKLVIDDMIIEAVPAYNIGKKFHPKENNWVGYIITLDSKRIYHAGDTDLIPEMKEITADIVLLPIGGTYTMTAEEAAEAVKTIKPRIAVPMHYGSVVGEKSDADRFEELCDCEVQRFDSYDL